MVYFVAEPVHPFDRLVDEASHRGDDLDERDHVTLSVPDRNCQRQRVEQVGVGCRPDIRLGDWRPLLEDGFGQGLVLPSVSNTS